MKDEEEIIESWIRKMFFENGMIYIHDIDMRFKDSKNMALLTLSKLYQYESNNLLASKFETFGDRTERVFFNPIQEEEKKK